MLIFQVVYNALKLIIVNQVLSYPNIFDRVLEKMKKRVPGISQVEAKNTEDGRLILRFQDSAFVDPFIDR